MADELFTAEVDGLREFNRDLKKFSPELAKELRQRLRELANVVAQDARRRAARDTGEMARKVRPTITQRDVGVKSSAPQSRLFEFSGRHPVFGTDKWVFQPARPFLFPAAEAHGDEMLTQAIEALKATERMTGFSENG